MSSFHTIICPLMLYNVPLTIYLFEKRVRYHLSRWLCPILYVCKTKLRLPFRSLGEEFIVCHVGTLTNMHSCLLACSLLLQCLFCVSCHVTVSSRQSVEQQQTFGRLPFSASRHVCMCVLVMSMTYFGGCTHKNIAP